MGCSSSKARERPAAVYDEATVQQVLTALRTLQTLAEEQPVALPIKPHRLRLPSGERGVGAAFLEAIRRWYAAQGGLGSTMEAICKHARANVCELTAGTGLSLAESVAYIAERDGLWLARREVAKASTFFSYSWTGTLLEDMLGAIEDTAARVDEQGTPRHVWIGACRARVRRKKEVWLTLSPDGSAPQKPACAPRSAPHMLCAPPTRPALLLSSALRRHVRRGVRRHVLRVPEPAGRQVPRRRASPEGHPRVRGT